MIQVYAPKTRHLVRKTREDRANSHQIGVFAARRLSGQSFDMLDASAKAAVSVLVSRGLVSVVGGCVILT